MNFQQIEYVIAVGELRNFKKAADKCFITQSTLSTMIARFEDEIGITVFNRKTKPVTVTKEGEEVIRQLKIISKEVNNLQEVVNVIKGEISGTLKIGIIPTVGPYLLPVFLNEFIKKFPKVHFEISEITTEKIIEYVERRDLDIGIVSIPLDNPKTVEIPLYNEPFLLFDTSDKVPKENFKISEIDFDRIWLLEEGHCMRTQVENICELGELHRTVNRNLDYKAGTIDTLFKFINKNDGITLLPLLSTLDFADDMQSHLHRFGKPVPVRTIGLIIHKHFVKKSILEALRLEIQEKVIPLLGERDESEQVFSPV